MTVFQLFLPALALGISALPLIPVFRKTTSLSSAKRRMYLQMSIFVFMFFTVLGSQIISVAAETATVANQVGELSRSVGYLSVALTTCCSCIGAAFAVAKAAPAAIGAISENPDNFGKAMIFVALAEGVAIYGLLISIMVLNTL
jgi:F0F1-type ATP synthase, subunit c/Archaeal/vacuolar-type H+-ATPase, subunit K